MIFRKKTVKKTYDPNVKKPVIRASICTGEQTAGFRYLSNGRFEEVMLIKSNADLEDFKSQYGIEGDIDTIY